MSEKKFYLYVKGGEMKKFKPVDWRAGLPVINLVFATLFTKENGEKALAEAKTLNPDWKFELRPA